MTGFLDSLRKFGTDTGSHWSRDNAVFEQTNPAFQDRVLRAVNPMTSFGSALGNMHDAAGKGFPLADTATALLQALPTFGAVRVINTPAQGAIKASQSIKDLTLRNLLASSGVSSAIEEAQAREVK